MKALHQHALAVWLLCITAVGPILAQAGHLTPGDGTGQDTTAVVFSPFRWEEGGDSGEDDFAKYLGMQGQKYSVLYLIERRRPKPGKPRICSVSSFHDVIGKSKDRLAVLFAASHGSADHLTTEYFGSGARHHKRARKALMKYHNTYKDTEVVMTTREENSVIHYSIGVTELFIKDQGALNDSIVHVASCKGGKLAEAFVTGGARVAFGSEIDIYCDDIKQAVIDIWSRMNGEKGIEARSIGEAIKSTSDLLVDGEIGTTLSPVVKELSAPCPIRAGDTIRFTFDTICDMGELPQMIGEGCTIETVEWDAQSNGTVLIGKCVETPRDKPVKGYCIALDWSDVKSLQNEARLDGNIRPYASKPTSGGVMQGQGGVGPARDDYYAQIDCGAD